MTDGQTPTAGMASAYLHAIKTAAEVIDFLEARLAERDDVPGRAETVAWCKAATRPPHRPENDFLRQFATHVLLFQAMPYASHADYQPEWSPDA